MLEPIWLIFQIADGDFLARFRNVPNHMGAEGNASKLPFQVVPGFSVIAERPAGTGDQVQAKRPVSAIRLQRTVTADIASAQGPEQILVLVIARGDLPAVGQNDVGRQQIVDCQPYAAGQVADTTTEGQTTATVWPFSFTLRR